MATKPIVTAVAIIYCSSMLAQAPANRRTELSQTAAGLLQQADIAHQAIANKDTASARDHAQQALAAAAKIQRIQEMAGAAGDPVVVPIYMEFESVSTTVPARKRNASVSEVTGAYTATYLNVSAAGVHLQSAIAAMDNGDLNAANTDLAAVQGDVMTKSSSGELPLVQARDNLALARTRVLAAKYKDAILPLKSASRALDRLAHQQPPPRAAKMAARLSIEIDAYAERIGHDHADAADRVTAWWNQVTDWFNSGMAEQ